MTRALGPARRVLLASRSSTAGIDHRRRTHASAPSPRARHSPTGRRAATSSPRCLGRASAFPHTPAGPFCSPLVLCADRVREMAAISSAKRDSTTAGTKDHAKAVVELEVYKEIGRAVGVNL